MNNQFRKLISSYYIITFQADYYRVYLFDYLLDYDPQIPRSLTTVDSRLHVEFITRIEFPPGTYRNTAKPTVLINVRPSRFP